MSNDFELWLSIIGMSFFAAVALTACDLEIERRKQRSLRELRAMICAEVINELKKEGAQKHD